MSLHPQPFTAVPPETLAWRAPHSPRQPLYAHEGRARRASLGFRSTVRSAECCSCSYRTPRNARTRHAALLQIPVHVITGD